MDIEHILQQYDEAVEIAEYHFDSARHHLRQARYWNERRRLLAKQLPAVTEAEQVAAAVWPE